MKWAGLVYQFHQWKRANGVFEIKTKWTGITAIANENNKFGAKVMLALFFPASKLCVISAQFRLSTRTSKPTLTLAARFLETLLAKVKD